MNNRYISYLTSVITSDGKAAIAQAYDAETAERIAVLLSVFEGVPTEEIEARIEALTIASRSLLSLCDLEDRHGRLVIKDGEKHSLRAALEPFTKK